MPNRIIFTFKLQKVYINDNNVRIFDYQVPAYNRDEALIKIGQTFNKEDEYNLTILEG